ncbi:MAG: hypothetical protein KF693_04095 [Nitrospira sp.]|nr:hypothetical protein [Nitrospira sp.]
MAGDFFSASWYRVERLKPRMRNHVHLQRHQYRGQIWYVLQDRAADRFHRFSPAAYHVIGLMDGRRTVRDIWDSATAALGDEAPSQDEVIRLLGQLHASDLMVCDVPPDTRELSDRADQIVRRHWKSRLSNIFAWRFPLCDPDRFLTRFLPLVRPFVGWTGILLWSLLVGLGVVLGIMHWSDLTQNILDQLATPWTLIALWLLFPVIKLLHELGHGFLTKAFGGEVHELGVMLLVFTPVPYVEASAAWAFRSKWQRILVGAGGMMVELALAAMALVVWINAEPGVVRLLAYNTIFIASVSTVIFNANPLLRFDGYYMLMDWLEIPNLRSRATAYARYLCERYLLGQREAELPLATSGERAWFLGYGMTSSIYRVLVVVAILIFLGEQWPLLGLLFAALTAVTMLGIPMVRTLSYLISHPSLRQIRGRAIVTSTVLVAAVIALLCGVPVPFHTMAEGVVWLPDEAVVRAGTDGFIQHIVAAPDSLVHAGDVLVVSKHPRLEAELRVLKSRVKELEARHAEQRPVDLVKAAIVQEELAYARDQLARVRHRADELVIRSRASGKFVMPAPQDLPGRFITQGETIAHVVDIQSLIVRAVVQQSDIDLIRNRHEPASARLAERLAESLPAYISRLTPAAINELPSTALGTEGGGMVPVDPMDPKGITSMYNLFHVDLSVPTASEVVRTGGRVYIRFSHEWAPLTVQWYRQVRQLFLTRFNV